MLRKLTLPLALVVAFGVASCGDDDDDGTGPTDAMTQISGSWQAQSFTYVAQDNPDNSLNLMDFGSQISLDITRTSATTGTFTGTALLPPLEITEPTPIGGEVTAAGQNDLLVDFNAATNQLFDDLNVTYQVTASTFTWTTSDVTMPTDGVTPAVLTVVLVEA